MDRPLPREQRDRLIAEGTYVFAHTKRDTPLGEGVSGILYHDGHFLPYVDEDYDGQVFPTLREAIAAQAVNIVDDRTEEIDCPRLPRAELAALLTWKSEHPAQRVRLNAVPYTGNGQPATDTPEPTKVREIAEESYLTRVTGATPVYTATYKQDMPFFSGDTDYIYESFGEYLVYVEDGVPEAYASLEAALEDKRHVDSECISITSSVLDTATILERLVTEELTPFTITINGKPHLIQPPAR